MTFAEKIKSLRKGKGLTQAQLAAVSNVSLAVIAGVESGRREPSKEVAKRLARYFKVPVKTFIIENTPVDAEDDQPQNIEKIAKIARNVWDEIIRAGYKVSTEEYLALVRDFYKADIETPNQIEILVPAILSKNQQHDEATR